MVVLVGAFVALAVGAAVIYFLSVSSEGRGGEDEMGRPSRQNN